MPWIFIGVASAAVMAIVSISDKTVVHKYARSPLSLPLLIGFSQTIVGIVVLSFTNIPSEATIYTSGFAILSGVLLGLSGFLLLRVIFTQEVSRALPVTQSAPIFAALLAWIFLNESGTSLQWLGIIAIVIGSTILSLRTRNGTSSIGLHKSFWVLILSAFFLGASTTIGKAALDGLPVWYTHGTRSLALGILFILLSLRSTSFADVKKYFVGRSPALVFVGINEFITANIGAVLFIWALSLGPAALVTALIGTRALFVVIYSTIITRIWQGLLGEEISSGMVITKLSSASLIVIGVLVMSI